MKAFLILITCLFCFTVLILLWGKIEHYLYIRKYAKRYSLEEIDSFIKENEDVLNKNVLDTIDDIELTDIILDHKELWEQVKKFKINKKL